jgi:hypothetical protein
MEKVMAGKDREESIRARAHELWEKEGRPEGAGERHWLQAASEVDASAAKPAAKKAAAPKKAAAKPKAPKSAAKPAAAGANAKPAPSKKPAKKA